VEIMVLRGKIRLILFLLSLFVMNLLIAPISIGELPKPQTDVGDNWIYSGNYMGTTATCNVVITQRTNITVEGKLYDVFVSVGTVDGAGPNNTSLHRVETAYFRVLDGAFVKTIDYFNYSSDELNQTSMYEYVYLPPIDMIHYPFNIGEKWENNYTLKTIDILSGNISETETNELYECEKTSSEFEMNKTFECYVVKKTEYIQDQRYDTRYYLSEVTGSEPVRLDVEYNGYNIVSLKINSYNIASATEPENNTQKTPGFEFILVIIVIALLFYLKRKK
jgi:hypothetical protein